MITALTITFWFAEFLISFAIWIYGITNWTSSGVPALYVYAIGLFPLLGLAGMISAADVVERVRGWFD